MIIDFDDPGTFPDVLKHWDNDFENRLCSEIHLEGVTEGWQIEHQLQELEIQYMAMVTNFVMDNPDIEIAVCHVTRQLDKSRILREGLVTGGGHASVAEKRLISLLEYIGLGDDEIRKVFAHIYYLWDRDGKTRTEAVHFFIDKKHIYKEEAAFGFASNLGGENLRWALEQIDINLYKKYPYKRLWLEGYPLIVKFKCKLSDIHEIYQNVLVAEIVKYYIVTQKYGYSYEFGTAGMTNGSVPAENIISIEEIHNFTEMQERSSEYENFYD